jgi:phosphatidylserine/phosphatidylglycerophosphate/cardiolipin synthase-like enzyme
LVRGANTHNDETLLVIDSPMVAAHYEREFGRLYAKAVLGVPLAVQQKIQAQKQECPQITQAKEKMCQRLESWLISIPQRWRN